MGTILAKYQNPITIRVEYATLRDMNSVLVLKEKHRDRYVHITSAAELHEAAGSIVADRILEGWYFEGDLDAATEATETPLAAWQFLVSRSKDNYEYEKVSLERLEKIPKQAKNPASKHR